MTERILTVAVDVGSGYTKYIAVPESGETEHMVRSAVTFRTAVGASRPVTIQPGHKPLVVEFEDRSFFVGQTAEISLAPAERTNPLSPSWAYEDGHRALLYYVLARALSENNIVPGEAPIKVRLVTGLPQAFYENGAEKVINLMQGSHRFRFKGQVWNLDLINVEVVPQAMGAYYTAAETFLSEADLTERVGVVDIGTFTTDFCLSEDIQYRAWESGGVAIGVSTLTAQLRNALERDFGSVYSDESLRKAFERRKILVNSAHQDVTKQVDEVTALVGAQLKKAIPASWDPKAMHLILAGGGAEPHLFGDWFQREWPHIRLIPSPGLAIVLGYAIYGASRYSV